MAKKKPKVKPVRKYRSSEINIIMSTSQYVVLKNSQLKDWEKIKEDNGFEDSHIYIITRRPRITLDTDKILYEGGKVKGKFEIHNTDSYGVTTLDFEYNDAYPTKRLKSTFPHSELTIYDIENDKEITKMDVTNFMRMLWKDHECLNLEVVYVGQSYAKGKRESAQRLQSHSTLQNVLADIVEKSPNYVVELVLLSFNDESLNILFDGISQTTETSEEEDKAHLKKVFTTPISFESKVNTTELALIRYFQPHYNIKLKDKYKPVGYYKKSLKDLYDLDLNQATVFLNLYDDSNPTSELLLFSTEVLPSSQHTIKLNLHDPAVRKQMDDFFD
ncbi:MAG: hypothetical protein WBB47_12265 [Paenisporosarcina sp.]